jgi:protein-tyrosine-phosphatase
MAEAFFNRLAKGRGKAKSAGTHPARRLDENVIEIMWEVGIEISRQRPKVLTPKLLNWADRVITMGHGVEGICPATFVDTEEWAIEDPKDKSVEKLREIREEIRARVTKLLDEITPFTN